MTQNVAIKSLRAHRELWPRDDFDAARVALFADLYRTEGPTALPPVVLVPDGEERYFLADGWHRVRAALLLNWEEIPAETREIADEPQAMSYEIALEYVVRSAQPLKRKELQAAIRRLAELHPDWSHRQIGKFLSVAHTTVGRVLDREQASQRDATEGESYIATVSAEELATRFFKAMEKVWEARGFGLMDSLLGDRTAERLASALRNAYGDDALGRAQSYRTWVDGAIKQLRSGA